MRHRLETSPPTASSPGLPLSVAGFDDDFGGLKRQTAMVIGAHSYRASPESSWPRKANNKQWRGFRGIANNISRQCAFNTTKVTSEKGQGARDSSHLYIGEADGALEPLHAASFRVADNAVVFIHLCPVGSRLGTVTNHLVRAARFKGTCSPLTWGLELREQIFR